MPVYICPNCRERSIDTDGVEGFSTQAPQCRSCGFGFLFQLLEDSYATTVVEGGDYSQAAPASPQAVPANQYWYYCTDPAGYYPYVQNCSKAWMQVVPQATPGAPRMAPQ